MTHPDQHDYNDSSDSHFIRGHSFVERDWEAAKEAREERSMARCQIDWPETGGEP
jgi:hypothetical protein